MNVPRETAHLNAEDEVADWRASPIRARSLAGLPPALIVSAGFDPLGDKGEAYAERLPDGGVRVDSVFCLASDDQS